MLLFIYLLLILISITISLKINAVPLESINDISRQTVSNDHTIAVSNIAQQPIYTRIKFISFEDNIFISNVFMTLLYPNVRYILNLFRKLRKFPNARVYKKRLIDIYFNRFADEYKSLNTRSLASRESDRIELDNIYNEYIIKIFDKNTSKWVECLKIIKDIFTQLINNRRLSLTDVLPSN